LELLLLKVLTFFAKIFIIKINIMWQSLAKFVIKNRIAALLFLLITTIVLGYFASKVKLGYEFAKAVPTDNIKYKDYIAFKEKFGDDGNVLVMGVTTTNFFEIKNFIAYKNLADTLKKVPFVEDVLSIPSSFTLTKDLMGERLASAKIFRENITSQVALDSAAQIFYSLPFYKNRLYNPATNSYLMAVRINKAVLATAQRTQVIAAITTAVDKYKNETKFETYVSGLPLIRTLVADRIKAEMKIFLIASILLSVFVLLLFFRSGTTTLLSLLVVFIGVIWSVGILQLCGYEISILTALIPSLMVVIGIPNCIYFINKYHSNWLQSKAQDNIGIEVRKENALVDMVSKMGIVTLFCNITAAIGFAVFAFTKSEILKEFGVVAGISIALIFVISFLLLPAALSLLSAPKPHELKYLYNKFISASIEKIQHIVFKHANKVLLITGVVLVFSLLGFLKLKSVGYIVDDLPKDDKVYIDLKYFEKNFKGIMPLEIVIDTKKRRGLSGMKALSIFDRVDSLAAFIAAQPEMNQPLSVAEGLKFAKQGFYDGDTLNYGMPNSFDGAFVGEYLRPSKDSASNGFAKTLKSFMDSSGQSTRISVSMADIGTAALPQVLSKVENRANQLFDSSYKVTFTGSSVTFLEGSAFIINGLKESIFWAFLLIALCMLFLFKSARVLLCSIIPNLIPLFVTAGVMGWVGVPLKPSTVLIFSVALGIAVDITIRFLVNYKQILPLSNNVSTSVEQTISQTGLSIIYTSLVLIAGFIIFCASGFGGTFALGWLTSLTLLTATLTNLILLPILLLKFKKKS
jgi:uncharacterized protein